MRRRAGGTPCGMILVSGGSGVMGARVVAGLLEAGHEVRALVLPGDPLNRKLDALDCEVHEGDITRPDSLAGAFDGVDSVYHLAAVILSRDPSVFTRVNLEGTRAMVEGARSAGVEQFIYVSSASVTYAQPTPYSQSKLAAERLVREQREMQFTVVRPTLVYDDNGGQEFMMFYDYLTAFPVVPFIGNGNYRKRPVWVGDLVQGLVAIAKNPVTYGKTYNLSGPEGIPIIEMARMMLAQKRKSRPFLRMPVPLCKALALGMGAVMNHPPLTLNAIAGVTQHADLDCADARRDLGYDPIRFEDGLRRCFG